MIFRNWVLQNFPFLEDDFDALTDYELFCKMVEYMKKSLEQITSFQNQLNDFKEELDSFENYFNNLDVQEEINNKLDEMAEDGTLENIIGEYIELQTTYTYNTVSDMKSATNLIDGSFTRTNGFYTYNDGGGALYKVRTITNEDTVDEMTLIALADESLVAELVYQDIMNPKQYGAKGDNTNDDTEAVQKCLSTAHNIIINDGTYLIDTDSPLEPQSNSYIKLNNATLKAIANNKTNYNIMKITDKDNIIIEGGTIEGDKDTHTGLTGEWGMCLTLDGGSTNITIKNVNLIKGWGDGLYINNVNHVSIENCFIDDNSRNGISVVNGNDIIVDHCELSNTDRTDPRAGIDLEPNADDIVSNVAIKNCYIHDNLQGIKSYSNNTTLEEDSVFNVTIANNKVFNSTSHAIELQYIKKYNVLNNIIDNEAAQTDAMGIRCIDAYDTNIIGNKTNNTDSCGISISRANNIIVKDNEISNTGYSFAVALNMGETLNSIVSNNIIHDCDSGGIQLIAASGKLSKNNVVDNNTIYNCGKRNSGQSGSYYDILVRVNVEKSIISNNNLQTVDYNYTKYAIRANDVTTENNIIKNNVISTKATGSMDIGNNITCDNIIDGALSLGNITRS